MAVTPANDAFTLKNRYTSSHSRSVRSPSPTAVSMGICKLTRRNTRRQSQGAMNGSALDEIREERQNIVGKKVERMLVNWEIPRKTLHASIGFFVVPLYTYGYTARPVMIVLSGMLVIICAAEVLRFNSAAFERIYEACLGALMRDSEKQKINGVVWYILGALIVLGTFPLDVAVVSILILSWADTTASTFGRLWGRLTPRLPSRLPIIPLLPRGLRSYISIPLSNKKTWAGFIAASLTAGVVGIGFWGWVARLRNSGAEPVWRWESGVLGGWLGLGVLGMVTGVIGGVAEALDVGHLDDNLTLPIISGGALWVFFRSVRWFFGRYM